MTQLSPWFDGEVRDGKLSLYHKDQFQSHLYTLAGAVQLKVEKLDRKRTTPQNRYLWGICYKLIADYTGAEPEEIHAALKFQFSPKRFIGNLVAPTSTAKLDTIEFSNYVEKVRRWAAEELSISIPDPNEVSL